MTLATTSCASSSPLVILVLLTNARTAHAPLARRSDDRGDRPLLPGPGGDHRPAHRPGQTDPRRKTCPVRSPAVRGAELTARLESALEVIYLIFNELATRRPLATIGCGLCSAMTRWCSGAFWPSFAPQEPEAQWSVALMGDPGVAFPRTRVARRESPSCSSIKTAHTGTNFSSAVVSRRSPTPQSWAPCKVRTYCRPRSQPVMRERALQRKPIGLALRDGSTAAHCPDRAAHRLWN